MSKVINLEGLFAGIDASEKYMDMFCSEIQAVLDEDYSELGLQASQSYLRPYMHPQPVTCIYEIADYEAGAWERCLISIHVQEWEMNRQREQYSNLLAHRLREAGLLE